MTIRISTHAREHWLGRCQQSLPCDGSPETFLRRVVENGRMASELEARCLALYLYRALHWEHASASVFQTERAIVSDAHRVMFALVMERGRVTVTTAARLSDVVRYARRVKGSMYLAWLKGEVQSGV